MEEVIREIIEEQHSCDKEQLDVIFTNEGRIIVEAPAGYGKTKTMISKIAYLIACEKVPNPKRILALTFSVNAAYKIKKDVAQNLPIMLSTIPISPVILRSKVLTTNYHGFCRHVLGLYGFLIHPNLKRIDLLMGIDDSNPKVLTDLDIGLTYDDAKQISDYNDAVKQISIGYLKKYTASYLNYVKRFFLPNNYIPFNAILVLTLELFRLNPQILQYYTSYFPIIIVDEFQDTNILSWTLLQRLINNHTRLVLMGDPLQRIYGFIGAIHDIMPVAQRKYEMRTMELKTNYRFKDNALLLQVDKNIREIANNPWNPSIEKSADIRVLEANYQEDESESILNLIKVILKKQPGLRTAVLFKQRGINTNMILDRFREDNLPFFYALYSDEDVEYIKFHRKSLDLFHDTISSSKGKLTKSICLGFVNNVKEWYGHEASEIHLSLILLLRTFIDIVFQDFNFITMEAKTEFIRDTLENRSLKQYLGYVDSNVIVSTVHGAKGLEWDYVFLPDMERYSFPSYLGLCGTCDFQDNCLISWDAIEPKSDFVEKFYQELSVFYVAATRAKKGIFFSYSKTRIDYRGKVRDSNLSCFLKHHCFKVEIL
jgi:DNA helicase-2/ATP-dependent DNA helicase PcrA